MAIELTMSFDDVKTRALETRAAQSVISNVWIWDSATLVQWDEWVRQFDATSATPTVSFAKSVTLATLAANNGRQALDGALSGIRLTVTVCVSALRAKAVLDPVLREVVEGLTASGNSRRTIEAEGLELAVAWEDYNPLWAPGSPYDLTALQTALAALPALKKPYLLTRTALKRAENALMRHAQLVEDQCIAWYIAASGRFPAGTVEGDLIRGSITTSYAPGGTPTPAKPTGITLMAIGNARVVADVADATGAIGYRWYVKGPSDADFVFKNETPTSEALLLSLELGANDIRVTGRNSGGESVPSDVGSVVVT